VSSEPWRSARVPSTLLARATNRAHRVLAEHLAAEGARRQHYPVLAALADHGCHAQAGLCRLLGIDGSDMVAVLNELQDKGYVARSRDPGDRRRNAVIITDAGRDALRRLDEQVSAANEVLLAPLTPAERDQLVALLSRLVAGSCGSDQPNPCS